MQAAWLTYAFAAALVASLAIELLLLSRQLRHVAAHRPMVPAPFADRVPLAAHQKAADYTLAKGRLHLLATAFSALVLLGWTLFGGLDALNTWVREAVQPRWGDMAYQLALLSSFTLIGSLLDLPWTLAATFGIEQRFGFNRTSVKLWLADQIKGWALAAVIGLPLAALILWLMAAAGPRWWLWAWGVWAAFNLLVMVVYPTWIAPLFNTFTPLADEALAVRVKALMARCGFAAKGLFVMDGSRRSAHGNAYFTGLGASKRVVFFDTLLASLKPEEVEAVLAHELGHFKRRHVPQRLALALGMSLAGLALLGWLAQQPAFFLGLGVRPNLLAPNHGLALLLFLLAVPVFAGFASPLGAWLSRRHEFEADAYAAAHADAAALGGALVKLHADNASTLTPDPWYVRWHFSHPPALQRLAALGVLDVPAQPARAPGGGAAAATQA